MTMEKSNYGALRWNNDPYEDRWKGFSCIERFYPDLMIQDVVINVELSKYKERHGAFSRVLATQRVCPEGNKCASSLHEAKKIVCPLDLPHTKYHTCIRDCIIYRNEHADRKSVV